MYAELVDSDSSRLHFGRITAADLSQIDRLLQMAADFFGTEFTSTQVPADEATFYKLIALSPDTIGLLKTESGQIAGWCTVFPTTIALMQNFLNRAITEKRMFDCTGINDTGAVYVMSVFVLPAYRRRINPMRLVVNTISPFLQKDIAIFYQGLTEAGARLGMLMQKKFSDQPYNLFAFG
jgi:hypothetical protein